MEKNIDININANTTGVKSLKAELRETIAALQQIPEGSAEFDVLANKAAELKDRMAGVNEQVNALASGSKYEKVTKSLGEMGAGLADLDFDRVKTGADLFAKSAKAITFKDAIGSVKQMGSALLTVGKAILTNPLFLLVGVVIAIVAGIVKLLDKLGWLKKAMDTIGYAIGIVVQALKDFLDFIGLTTFAAEDAASKQQDAFQKIADKAKEVTEIITTRYDREIELAKISGKDTTKAELEKQNAIIKTQQIRYKALLDIIEQNKISKRFNEEEIKALKDQAVESRKTIEDARHQKDVINAQEVEDNKAKNEKIAEENKAAAKRRKDQEKQFAEDRLAAMRMIQDLELELMQEGVDKELKANELKYQRLIEDTKKNEKLLSEEKQKVIADLMLQEEANRKKIINDQVEADRAEREAAKIEQDEREAEQRQREAEIMQEAGQAMLDKQIEFYQKERDEAIKAREAKIGIATDYANSVNNLTEGIFSLTNRFGAQDEKSKEQRARRQFAVQKALMLSLAVMDGFKAANASLAQSPIAIGPVPNPAGIASLAFAVTTSLANIAKIASSQYKSSAGSAPAGGGGGVGSSAPQVQSATPSFSLFGANNNSNNLNTGNNNQQQQMVVKAVVVESDITSTQGRIQKMKENASL